MATTVGQHSVATFTSPVNGTTPIDANTVRGNDNTLRTSYVDHDADPGIHVQSSTLASRPVAGTAGRKWITEDSGVYTLWFDDGTNWHPVSSENIALTVLATQALNKGDVVKVVGWNNGQDLPEVAKVASSSDIAFAVMSANATINTMGYAVNTGILQDVATNTFSVGDILYPNTSGGFTATKPTSGVYQPVAFVLRSNASNGVIYVEFSAPRIVERSDNTASTLVLRDSNGDFAAGTITATAVNATTLDLTNLEVTNIKAKDGTQAIAIADSTGKLTISDGVLLSGLTASQAVFTDSSKNLVSNAITGTGNVVMSASPTLTGTVTAATISATTLGGTLSTAAQPNVTSVGTLSSLTVSGTATAANMRVNTSVYGADGLLRVFGTASNEVLQIAAYSASLAAFYGGSGVSLAFYANAAEGMRLTSTGLGIGTTPTYKLDVASSSVTVARLTSSSTVAYLGLKNSGSEAYIGADSSGNFIVQTPGSGFSTKLTVDSAGNLGLGVTPSAWGSYPAFEMLGGSLYSFGAGNFFRVHNGYFNGSSWVYKNSAAAFREQIAGAGITWSNAPSGTAGNAITWTSAMTLDAAGNLGLGVTPSAWGGSYKALQLPGGAIDSFGSNAITMICNAYDASAGAWTYKNTGVALRYDQNSSGAHVWLTAPSGTAGNAISFTQAMTLDASGQLAIGTATASATLGRNITMNGTNAGTNTGVILSSAGVERGFIYGNDTQIAVGSITSIPTVFTTNNTERARITSGGYFKASDNGTYIGSTGTYHELSNSANDVGLAILNSNASFTSAVTLIRASRAASGAFNLISAQSNLVEQFVVSGSGIIYAQNTTVQSVSDARLKENVRTASEGLAIINALRPVRYDWKAGHGNDRTNQLGFIAQEVEAVFADAVSEWKMGEETYKTVGPGALIPVLVNAIKELSSRVAALEAQ